MAAAGDPDQSAALFLVIVKGVFLKDIPLSEVVNQTIPLALIAAVTLSAAAWLFAGGWNNASQPMLPPPHIM